MAGKTIKFPISRAARRSYKVSHDAKLCCQFCDYFAWDIVRFKVHVEHNHPSKHDYPPHIVYVKRAKDLTTKHHD